jgi:hypothetical protein
MQGNSAALWGAELRQTRWKLSGSPAAKIAKAAHWRQPRLHWRRRIHPRICCPAHPCQARRCGVCHCRRHACRKVAGWWQGWRRCVWPGLRLPAVQAGTAGNETSPGSAVQCHRGSTEFKLAAGKGHGCRRGRAGLAAGNCTVALPGCQRGPQPGPWPGKAASSGLDQSAADAPRPSNGHVQWQNSQPPMQQRAAAPQGSLLQYNNATWYSMVRCEAGTRGLCLAGGGGWQAGQRTGRRHRIDIY